MRNYVSELEKTFQQHSNPEKAGWMKKYMRNQYEFIGLASPERKKIKSEFIRKNGKPAIDELDKFLFAAWENPYREIQHTAMEIANSLHRNYLPEHIDLFEELIQMKSWWDTIDYIAPTLAGTYFIKYPETRIPFAEKWMNSLHVFLMRSSVIYQLKYKENTDTEFLFRACQNLSGEKDFFIRKAIGWALRQYSKYNADAVIDFVNNNKLSPLSKKEALKWLNRKKAV